MPPKENKQNKASKAKEKRKEISPLFEIKDAGNTQSTCNSTQRVNVQADQCSITNTGIGGVPHGAHGLDNINIDGKRQKVGQTELFCYETSHIAGMQSMNHPNLMNSPMNNMNNPQFTTFPGQYVQSPPNYQYTHQNTHAPPWATEMMKEIQAIREKVNKIDVIEKTVNLMNKKLHDLDTKVNDIDKRVLETENALSFIGDGHDQQKKELKTTQEEIKRLNNERQSLEKTINSMEKSQEEIRAKTLENEFRSMRDNLIFYGIAETTAQTTNVSAGASADVNTGIDVTPMTIDSDKESKQCEYLVKDFIQTRLDIDSASIVFDRAHRLGARKSSQPRPVIVKFHYFQQREKVREAAFQKRMELKGSNSGVSVQLPREWREARQKLSPVFADEKRKGNKVKFVGEHLYINGKLYTRDRGNQQ